MYVVVKFKWLACLCAWHVLLAAWVSAQTTVIFVADDDGNVGRVVAGQSTGTALGSLSDSGFTANQVIGLAYDSNTHGILLFDRGANTVYSMNATTGHASVLFTTPGVQLQGGAIFDGLIYAINENTERLEAYSFSGVDQNLPHATDLTGHTHSLATNPVTQTLFYLNSDSGIHTVNADGSDGSPILSVAQSSEDIAYFTGDYLVASYDRQLYFLDGETGSVSTYLTDEELAALGVTGSVSGVVVEYVAVPEPATWMLMLLGVAAVGWLGLRRRAA